MASLPPGYPLTQGKGSVDSKPCLSTIPSLDEDNYQRDENAQLLGEITSFQTRDDGAVTHQQAMACNGELLTSSDTKELRGNNSYSAFAQDFTSLTKTLEMELAKIQNTESLGRFTEASSSNSSHSLRINSDDDEADSDFFLKYPSDNHITPSLLGANKFPEDHESTKNNDSYSLAVPHSSVVLNPRSLTGKKGDGDARPDAASHRAAPGPLHTSHSDTSFTTNTEPKNLTVEWKNKSGSTSNLYNGSVAYSKSQMFPCIPNTALVQLPQALLTPASKSISHTGAVGPYLNGSASLDTSPLLGEYRGSNKQQTHCVKLGQTPKQPLAMPHQQKALADGSVDLLKVLRRPNLMPIKSSTSMSPQNGTTKSMESPTVSVKGIKEKITVAPSVSATTKMNSGEETLSNAPQKSTSAKALTATTSASAATATTRATSPPTMIHAPAATTTVASRLASKITAAQGAAANATPLPAPTPLPALTAATAPIPKAETTKTTTASAATTTTAPEEASSAAAETASQDSSVSSCFSLTDNINKHTDAAKDMDFGYLKSAMKKSCECDSRGHRKMSLFSTVMRRVSIHRRDSTPANRFATFLFGSDEEKGGEKREDEEELDSKQLSALELLQRQRAKRRAQLRESLFLILSGLYGIIIVILGAVIPITEIFIAQNINSTADKRVPTPQPPPHGFYVYLFGVSIIFLIYVYAYLLRRNRLKLELLTRTLSRSLSWHKTWAKNLARADTEAKGKLRKRMISLDVYNHHTGTFYLRLGVLGFGIGSMIHTGLSFGSRISVSGCNGPVHTVKPLIHLAFTFFQLYFIFMNSKMCIHRYKKLARFGLIHMCATNICVWFRSIVVETLHVIHQYDGHGQGHGLGHSQGHGQGHHFIGEEVGVTHEQASHVESAHDSGLPVVGYHGNHHSDDVYSLGGGSILTNMTEVVNIGRKLHAATEHATTVSSGLGHAENDTARARYDDCQWNKMMLQAVEAAGPYLYPCTIEYSLMCAGILYIMWRNVGRRPRRPRRSELETASEDGHDEDEQRAQRMSVDCTSSSRGLFLGILLMVVTIISIIAFYMLMNQEELEETAIILTHLSGTFIYSVTLLALIMAAVRMKNLSFQNEHEAGLEDILILISYTGLLAFIIFSLIASILDKPSTQSTLTILSNVAMLVQSTVQTIFMLAGDRMSAATDQQVRKKPGREFITFLLISNFAMWAINIFETQTPQHNPIQVKFYGPEAWAIFTHISVPLGIYYRFHSTVCFSNIWKNAWKRRKHHV